MAKLRTSRTEKTDQRATQSKFAAWQDRAYFLAGYFTGLCALGLIIFSIFGHLEFQQTRDRNGWDLSRPEHIDPRTIGQ